MVSDGSLPKSLTGSQHLCRHALSCASTRLNRLEAADCRPDTCHVSIFKTVHPQIEIGQLAVRFEKPASGARIGMRAMTHAFPQLAYVRSLPAQNLVKSLKQCGVFPPYVSTRKEPFELL